MMPTPTIRPARPEDAPALAELAERTFRDAFTAQNAPENMDLHCASSYGEAFQLAEILDPDVTTLVVQDGPRGSLIAYAQMRRSPAPAGVDVVDALEIHRIYVDRPWHGRGVAHDLMAELLRLAEEAAAGGVWLGVWEANPRALAFYAKWGFTEVGEQTYTVGTDLQRDLVLLRRS